MNVSCWKHELYRIAEVNLQYLMGKLEWNKKFLKI